MSAKDILRLGIDLQAMGLAADSYKFAKKKNKKTKDFINQGTKAIIGSELIRIQGGFLDDF